jgi:hypothetical protein
VWSSKGEERSPLKNNVQLCRGFQNSNLNITRLYCFIKPSTSSSCHLEILQAVYKLDFLESIKGNVIHFRVKLNISIHVV